MKRRKHTWMRCRTCYLPLRDDLPRCAYRCWLCGWKITGMQIAERGRLRRWVDWITGIEYVP